MADFPPPQSASASPTAPVSAGLLAYALFAIGAYLLATVPADPVHRTSPRFVVIVTSVLLKVALMCATPRVTPLRSFFFAPAFAPVAGFDAPELVAADSAICGISKCAVSNRG
jgi:hypothetical protein